jgi:hypothetical protein
VSIENAVEEGLTAALKNKRPCDLWWIHRYGTNEAAHQNTLSVATEDRALISHRRAHQNLLADEVFIKKFIPGPGRWDEASADITTAIRRLLDIAERTAGERHVFICFDRDCPVGERALREFAEAASESHTFLHGIIPGPDSEEFFGIRRLCESSGGTFGCMEVERIPEFIAATYEHLLNRYDVTYEATGADGVPHVRLISQYGFAELNEERINLPAATQQSSA